MIIKSEGLTLTNKGDERLMTKQENMNTEVNKNKQSVCEINYEYKVFNKEEDDYNDMTGSVEVDMDEQLFKTLYDENTDTKSNLQYNDYQYDGFFNTLDNELDKRGTDCDDWEDLKVVGAELVKVGV